MRCFVVVPGALVPASLAADVLAEARRQGAGAQLQRLLERAAVDPYAPMGSECARAPHLAWTWKQFGGHPAVPVTAPYVARLLAGSAMADDLWHCDPVHIAFARDHLLLTDLAAAPLSADEAGALLHSAQQAAQAHGARILALQDHWFIAFDQPLQIEATPLAAALDSSVHEALPHGADATRWRRLLNEIQMLWHEHPVNQRREAEGRRTVNGLWLHGGGAASALHSAFAMAWTDDLLLRAWANASDTGVTPMASAPTAASGDLLVQLPALAPAQRRADWIDWIARLPMLERDLARVAAVVRHLGGTLEVLLFGTYGLRRARVAGADRWRLWRQQVPERLMAEPAEATA